MTNLDNSPAVQTGRAARWRPRDSSARHPHQQTPFPWASSHPRASAAASPATRGLPPSFLPSSGPCPGGRAPLPRRVAAPPQAAQPPPAAGPVAPPAPLPARRGQHRAARSPGSLLGPPPTRAGGQGRLGGGQPATAALARLEQAGRGGALPGAEEGDEKHGLPPQGQTPPAATAPLASRCTNTAAPSPILPGPQFPPRPEVTYPSEGRASPPPPSQHDPPPAAAAELTSAPRRPIGQRRSAAPAGGAV